MRRTNFCKGERVIVDLDNRKALCIFVSEVSRGLKVTLPGMHAPFTVPDNSVSAYLVPTKKSGIDDND